MEAIKNKNNDVFKEKPRKPRQNKDNNKLKAKVKKEKKPIFFRQKENQNLVSVPKPSKLVPPGFPQPGQKGTVQCTI